MHKIRDRSPKVRRGYRSEMRESRIAHLPSRRDKCVDSSGRIGGNTSTFFERLRRQRGFDRRQRRESRRLKNEVNELLLLASLDPFMRALFDVAQETVERGFRNAGVSQPLSQSL